MGSSNSRLGSGPSRPSRPRVNRRKRRLSPFICGSLSPSSHEMEEHPAEALINSTECCDNIGDNSPKESSLIFSEADECSSSMAGNEASCESSNNSLGEISVECNSKRLETINDGRFFSERKEFLAPCQEQSNYNMVESYWERNADVASTSKDLEPRGQTPLDVGTSLAAVVESDILADVGESQICTEGLCSSNMPSELGESCLEWDPLLRNCPDEVLGVQNSDSNSISGASDSPANWQPLGDGPVQEFAAPLDPGVSVPARQRDQESRSLLHVDVVSISSDSLSSSTEEISNREARRNSRRLFWDAFSRRSFRRRGRSPAIVFSSEDTEVLGSHDRWLLDFNDDLYDNGFEDDLGYVTTRSRGTHGQRWHSRSEIWERLRGGLDGSGQTTTFCASGLHPDGTCSCEAFLMAEETGTRASISRIVMLAEALFEVLDEIHRQPVSLSLSMVSLPAPESVVDSFPLKSHKKPDIATNGDDVEQCYICLAEYDEGDKIRVLPCRHQYHMPCIDKWLKEFHGVCPLCRGDVCESVAECSVSYT